MTKAAPWVIVGGTGMTGHRVLELVLERHAEAPVIATSRAVAQGLPAGPLAASTSGLARKHSDRVRWSALDFEADGETVEKQLEHMGTLIPAGANGGVLVVAAAFTNVDGCENDPARCKRVNEENTIAALSWGLERGMQIVFFSTDYVFDGTAGPYGEKEPRHAESVYGQSKAAVEEWIGAHAGRRGIIVRTTGVYDYLPGSMNFLMQVLKAGEEGRTMKVPSDQWANPVWARELALAAVELAEDYESGIFHAAGGQWMPRDEFGRLICEIFKLPDTIVVPVLTAELGQKAKRPLKGGLKCDGLQYSLGWVPQAPRPVLEAFRARING